VTALANCVRRENKLEDCTGHTYNCYVYRFCRATLYVSAVFAVVRCPTVCPSFRLSRWCSASTLLSRPAVAPTPSAGTQFQGNPFSGGEKYTGVGKCCNFRLKSVYLGNDTRKFDDIFSRLDTVHKCDR